MRLLDMTSIRFNGLFVTDPQQQEAILRRLLRAGQRTDRYLEFGSGLQPTDAEQRLDITENGPSILSRWRNFKN